MPTILRRDLKNSQPTLRNNFTVEFPASYDIPNWLVQTSSLPKLKIEPIEIPYFNTSQYMDGRYKWEAIDITFIAPIGPSTTQKLMEALRLALESLTGRMGYVTSYKHTLYINILDPTGSVVGKWALYDCQITDFTPSEDLDYGTGDIIKPKITVQPDYCELLF